MYVHGKAFCKASNRGDGGPDSYDPIKSVAGSQNELQEKLTSLNSSLGNFPVTDYPNLKNNLELVVGGLLNDFELIKETRSILRKVSTLECEGGKYCVQQWPAKYKPTADVIQRLKEKFGTKYIESKSVVFLNLLSLEEAHELLKKHFYS